MGLLNLLFGNKNQQLPEYIKKGAVILDVRTLSEYKGGHVKNALHIPVQELSNRYHEIKKLNKPVIAYCASGIRSGSATSLLKSKGIDVINGGSFSKVQSALQN
jgi:rhodanese-related sulfurtransferase